MTKEQKQKRAGEIFTNAFQTFSRLQKLIIKMKELDLRGLESAAPFIRDNYPNASAIIGTIITTSVEVAETVQAFSEYTSEDEALVMEIARQHCTCEECQARRAGTSDKTSTDHFAI